MTAWRAAVERGLEQREILECAGSGVKNGVGIVERGGASCTRFKAGDRVGIAWLRETCALIAGLVRDRLRDEPGSDVAHMTREAWYYLRTSIDPTWQFDAGEPSLPAALAYLAIVLRERPPAGERAALLGRLRSDAGTLTTRL